jgi:hypothetical protein
MLGYVAPLERSIGTAGYTILRRTIDMSKKHFIALAQALSFERPSKDDTLLWPQWKIDVLAVSDVCAHFNPAFDRGRFIAACEGE